MQKATKGKKGYESVEEKVVIQIEGEGYLAFRLKSYATDFNCTGTLQIIIRIQDSPILELIQ